jgi:hypothetical protein
MALSDPLAPASFSVAILIVVSTGTKTVNHHALADSRNR